MRPIGFNYIAGLLCVLAATSTRGAVSVAFAVLASWHIALMVVYILVSLSAERKPE